MSSRTSCVSVLALLALISCSRQPSVALSPTTDVEAFRWNAVVATTEALRGVVQTRGVATLTPHDDGKQSVASIRIENAVPGGRHPWAIRGGQCGIGGGEIARVTDDNVLRVGKDGRATADVTLDNLPFPSTGDFYVEVVASMENPTQVIACGNFAPPSNRGVSSPTR